MKNSSRHLHTLNVSHTAHVTAARHTHTHVQTAAQMLLPGQTASHGMHRASTAELATYPSAPGTASANSFILKMAQAPHTSQLGFLAAAALLSLYLREVPRAGSYLKQPPNALQRSWCSPARRGGFTRWRTPAQLCAHAREAVALLHNFHICRSSL